MHFSEHELTAALTGAAKSVVRAQRKDVRKGTVDIDTAWDEMDRFERFRLLDAVGDQVLPVLAALPEVEVAPGGRPTYADRQVTEIVSGLVGHDVGRLRRVVLVKARTALVQAALAHVPARLDPDVFLDRDDG
ncbi:MAG: hypothetical protein ABWX84_04235 [Nocardioides sp.]